MEVCFLSWKPKLFKIMVSFSNKSFHLKIRIDFGGKGNINNNLLLSHFCLLLTRPGCDNSGNSSGDLLCCVVVLFFFK